MYSRGKQGICGCGKINANIYTRRQCRVTQINLYNLNMLYVTGAMTHIPEEIRGNPERGQTVEV